MTEIAEASRELVAFVCATRPDWDPDETWTAVLACKTAGYEWPRIARDLVTLALKDEPAPTRPQELWHAVRASARGPRTSGRLDPGVKAELFAELAEKTTGILRGTGGQPALTEEREREFLREGPDP